MCIANEKKHLICDRDRPLADLSAKSMFNVADHLVHRTSAHSRERTNIANASVVLPLQNLLEAEPRKPIPRLRMIIAQVIFEPLAQSLFTRKSDVMGTMITVQNIDPLHISEVGDTEPGQVRSPAPEQTEYGIHRNPSTSGVVVRR
jgi:hypothetical protein